MKPFLPLALILAATTAHADMCDFKPSVLAGKAGNAVKNTASDVASAATRTARAVGAYTLQNPVSGASMISSGVGTVTAAGSSIASGASGALASAGAVATAPVTLTIAGVTAVGLAGYEGVCYFKAEKITDYDEILYIVSNLAENSDPTMFALIPDGSEYTSLEGNPAIAGKDKIRVASAGVGPWILDVDKLYIADGMLKHRDRLRDTVIGNVALQVVKVE